MAQTILLVEDTRTITALIQVLLMGWDFRFVVARDGEEGLIRARASRPDLIISDVQMERCDGFEFCAAIRADTVLRDTPVVLLTSLNDQTARDRGAQVGATAFLNKPVTAEQLRDTVAGLLTPRKVGAG